MVSASNSTKATLTSNELSAPKKKFFDFENISFLLILHDIVILLPFSYTLPLLLKYVFQYLGFGNAIHSATGVFLSRVSFITVNILLVNIWAARLGREAAKRKDLESEIRLLDAEIEKLEGLLQEVKEAAAAADDILNPEDSLVLDDDDEENEEDDGDDEGGEGEGEDQERVLYDSEEDSDDSIISAGSGEYGFRIRETNI